MTTNALAAALRAQTRKGFDCAICFGAESLAAGKAFAQLQA
jgi:hypothetical protein